MVVGALVQGFAETGPYRRLSWAAALGRWLCFDALLRPAELLRLRVEDLVFPSSLTFGPDPHLIIVLHSPKTRHVWRTQFTLCTDETLIRWLQCWSAQLSPGCSLFGMSRFQFARVLYGTCEWLAIDGLGYTLASFPRGGATYDFRGHRNLGALQFKGRWKSQSTLQHYIMEAMSAHTACKATSLAESAIRTGLTWLKEPPKVSARRKPSLRATGKAPQNVDVGTDCAPPASCQPETVARSACGRGSAEGVNLVQSGNLARWW